MGKINKDEKVFRSIIEFEKEFLPNAFQAKAKKEQKKEPGSFGSKLASEFLENVKRKLSK